LARLTQELIAAARLMGDILEPASSGLVTDAIRTLEHQVYRIAIIGQIKAGKSSFVNALVQHPDLLPIDVNPWTTAVTNLHFCRRQEQELSAIFKFFSRTEWQQLADGGGKLRELTERLVPGFEPELLRRHVSTLRERAAARLGPEFAELLGRSHEFATLSPDVLRRYVCQGDLVDVAEPSHSDGRYSDITRSADIYLGAGPFDYPITIIDTPGTNDPFLVRDEITRQSLESADLYVVVLTAHQALADSDVALLRILRGLHKERVVIFLNRIDELHDIARDTELVSASIRRRLRNELPGAEIPLIPGSAWWGNCALAGPAANLSRCLERHTLDYMERKGLLQRGDLARPAERDEAGSGFREALFVVSGLSQVYAALNRSLSQSHYSHVLRQMTSCFGKVVNITENASLEELQSLSQGRADAAVIAKNVQSELSRVRGESQRLQTTLVTINRSSTLFRERLQEIVTSELAALRDRLLHRVGTYALKERDALADQLLAGKVVRTWRFDTQALRRELADDFMDGFRKAETRLLGLQHEVVPHLRDLLSLLVPNPTAMDSEVVHRPVPPPTMMSLGAYLAVDLDDSWWSLLWSARPAPLRRGRELEALIRSEFRRVVDELLAAFEQSLSEHVNVTTEWSFGVCERIAHSISRRREQLVSHYEGIEHKFGGAAGRQVAGDRQRYVALLNERLGKCAAVSHRLDRIGRAIAREFPLVHA
jgi:hypothetical protein